MSSFVNPLGRPAIDPERSAAIKLWTRQTLELAEETTVTVGEFGCDKPTCPNRQTIILVMSGDTQTRRIRIHKSMVDVSEIDVVDACFDPRNAPPSDAPSNAPS
jgi:hypothetical protein